MSTISRRAFLKTVGVGALSVAAVSVLAGCDAVKVPGTETTPVVGAIEGAKDVSYKVSDTLTVGTTTDIKAVEGKMEWAKAYVNGYNEVVAKASFTSATDAQKAEATDNAKAKAAYVKNDTAEVEIVINNYSDKVLILAESGKTGEYKSSAFTATCNGAAVECTVNQMSVPAMSAGAVGTQTFTCKVKLPCNTEKFEIVVALPDAKAVKYSVTNKNYKKASDLEPTNDNYTAFYGIAGL